MAKAETTPVRKLNEEAFIPVIGLGTWQLTNGALERALEYALDIGYRHIDTADAYGNHKTIGEVINRSRIEREDLFITSKIWWTDLKKEDLRESFERSLAELDTEYIDLLLIHWPNRDIPVAQPLEAMGRLREEGKIKALGVSNFTINHLKDALTTAEALEAKYDIPVEITNNQIEYHPSFNQKELRDFCQKNDITVTAYSPIAQGDDLKIDEIQEIANKYGTTEAKVIIKWLIEKGLIVIPRSEDPEHIRQNFEALQLDMENEDIEIIDNLDKNNRILNPEFADFDY
jgi:diketogulonate reductase-like aldo/keto reductase